MNHFNNLVAFILLPNLVAFLQLFIWKPMIYSIRQCLNKPVGKKCGNLKDFIIRVVLNQVYIPFHAMRCLLNPEDNDLKDIHWDMKVMFVYHN